MRPLKKVCLYVHRYFGWFVGIFFLALCLTGCILAIQPDVERMAEPWRYKAPAHPGETMMTPGTLVATFERFESESFEQPTTVHVQRLQTSSDPGKAWYALVLAKNEERAWAYVAYIDPFTGKGVSYGTGSSSGFFRSVRGWHNSLKLKSIGFLTKPVAWLAGEKGEMRNPGSKIVGLVSLLAALVLLTGFIRWFPKLRKNKNLKDSFLPVLNHGGFRANYSLHNVLGFYAALLLLVMSLSGAWMALPRFSAFCDKLVGYDASAGTAAKPRPASAADLLTVAKSEGDRDGAGRGEGRGMGRGEGRGEGAGRGEGRGQGGARGEGRGMGPGPGAAPEAEDTTNYGDGVLADRSPKKNGFSPRALGALMTNVAYKCDAVLETQVPLDVIFREQQALTPSYKGYDIVIPVAGVDRAVTITKYDPVAGFCKPDMYYWNQYTGKNLGKTSFSDLSFAEQFRALIRPIHTGEVFGAASRYALFVGALLGLILAITGYAHMTLRLIHKGKARRAAAGQEEDADGTEPASEEKDV